MKNLDSVFVFTGVMSLVLFIGVWSCGSHNNQEFDSKPSQRIVGAKLNQHQWRITYFFNNDDQTHLFSGYHFKFSDDGSFVATGSRTLTTGTWSAFGAETSNVQLKFDFGFLQPFDLLNKSWIVTELTDDKVVFTNGSAGRYHVTFEKERTAKERFF